MCVSKHLTILNHSFFLSFCCVEISLSSARWRQSLAPDGLGNAARDPALPDDVTYSFPPLNFILIVKPFTQSRIKSTENMSENISRFRIFVVNFHIMTCEPAACQFGTAATDRKSIHPGGENGKISQSSIFHQQKTKWSINNPFDPEEERTEQIVYMILSHHAHRNETLNVFFILTLAAKSSPPCHTSLDSLTVTNIPYRHWTWRQLNRYRRSQYVTSSGSAGPRADLVPVTFQTGDTSECKHGDRQMK